MDQYIEFISNHYLLTLALAVVTYLLLQDLSSNIFKKFESLSPLITVSKMNSTNTVIIDIRTVNDYLKSHITNSINIPIEKFSTKLDTLEQYKNSFIIVVCQTGNISVSACKTLTKAGFTQISNIAGGIQSWQDNNLPLEKTSKNNKSA